MNASKSNPINKLSENKIVLYTDKNGNVELRADVEKDTLWATQEQIGRLFEVTVSNVSLHIINIFDSKELNKNSVIKESLITAKDNKQYKAILYNLDVIIAVGYRVNSKKATKFRIWATKVLKEYLIKGYNLNSRQLVASEDKFTDLHKAISFIESESVQGKVKAKVTVSFSKKII